MGPWAVWADRGVAGRGRWSVCRVFGELCVRFTRPPPVHPGPSPSCTALGMGMRARGRWADPLALPRAGLIGLFTLLDSVTRPAGSRVDFIQALTKLPWPGRVSPGRALVWVSAGGIIACGRAFVLRWRGGDRSSWGGAGERAMGRSNLGRPPGPVIQGIWLINGQRGRYQAARQFSPLSRLHVKPRGRRAMTDYGRPSGGDGRSLVRSVGASHRGLGVNLRFLAISGAGDLPARRIA